MSASRRVLDCRWFPSLFRLRSGDEEKVLNLAVQHAVDAHGCCDTPALREQLRSMMCDEAIPNAA
jgi:hypothetical protein